MFLHFEETPNPNSMKFYTGEVILSDDVPSMNFTDKNSSVGVPLVEALFATEHVVSILLLRDAVVVTKLENIPWEYLKNDLISHITEFVATKQLINITTDNKDSVTDDDDLSCYSEEDREVVKSVLDIIDNNIRPLLLSDGGDIVFKKYVDGDVYVHLIGACNNCPSASVTLKSGIQNMLQYHIPCIKQVISV